MDNKEQKIFCTVDSCIYNNNANACCTLKEIKVTPTQNCNTKKADESQCSSYKYEQE